MKPTKSILDPTFRYTDSASTDIRKTFAKARKQQRIATGFQRPPAVQRLAIVVDEVKAVTRIGKA